MRFLLANFFQSSGFLVIVLIAAMVLLCLASFSRRRKEQKYRDELSAKIIKGAKVKTYTGIYGTVISIRNTTDGKLVLIETGEGDKTSYQQIHINSIYGIDDSEEMVIDSEGNEIPLSELNKPKTENEELEDTAEELVEDEVEDEVEEKPKKSKKSSKKDEE